MNAPTINNDAPSGEWRAQVNRLAEQAATVQDPIVKRSLQGMLASALNQRMARFIDGRPRGFAPVKPMLTRREAC